MERAGATAVPAPLRRRVPADHLRGHPPADQLRRGRRLRHRRRQTAPEVRAPRFSKNLRDRRDHARDATAHRPAPGRPPKYQHHHGIQGRLPQGGHQRPPGLHRPTSGATPGRRVPHPHRRRVGGVPWSLRPAQGVAGHLRPVLRHRMPPRALLHPLPPAAPRPSPTRPADRDRQQPTRPSPGGTPAGLGRGSRRPEDQPRRHPSETRPHRPDHRPPQRRRPPGHARLPRHRRPDGDRHRTCQPRRATLMTTLAVTADLLHHLVTGSHAEGVTALAVQAAIGHDTGVLLVADHGADFIDHTWQLPGGTVLPGQSLTDALHPVVATIGMSITEVTGYLGHHNDHTGQEVTRTFCFTVTVTDPDAICRSAIIGHRWACLDDLPSLLGLPNQAAWPLAQPAAPTPAAQEPQLSEPLRTWARGIYSDEAAVELLIAHAAFLNRSDFIDRCVVPKANHADNQTAASIDLDTRNAALLSQAILHATGHRPPDAAPNPLTPKRFR